MSCKNNHKVVDEYIREQTEIYESGIAYAKEINSMAIKIQSVIDKHASRHVKEGYFFLSTSHQILIVISPKTELDIKQFVGDILELGYTLNSSDVSDSSKIYYCNGVNIYCEITKESSCEIVTDGVKEISKYKLLCETA